MAESTTTPTPKAKKEKPKKSMQREIVEWVITLVLAVALALAIRSFLFEPVRVDGESMQSTLQNNEYMIATKWNYLWNNPERFDVVICSYPNRTETFVKRVVGLPGETVELRENQLYINGELVPENFDKKIDESIDRPPQSFGPVVVPEDCYFVMGDHRFHSNDSRMVGALPRSMIRGHVRYVVFPFNKIRAIPTPEQ
jgi:signal peptidase I